MFLLWLETIPLLVQIWLEMAEGASIYHSWKATSQSCFCPFPCFSPDSSWLGWVQSLSGFFLSPYHPLENKTESQHNFSRLLWQKLTHSLSLPAPCPSGVFAFAKMICYFIWRARSDTQNTIVRSCSTPVSLLQWHFSNSGLSDS